MNSKQRAFLKSIAQNTDVSMNIGKNGYTPEVTKSLGELFNTRELVKVSINQNCIDNGIENPKELAYVLAERTHSEVVQIIGRKIVFYKPFKDEPKIILPKK